MCFPFFVFSVVPSPQHTKWYRNHDTILVGLCWNSMVCFIVCQSQVTQLKIVMILCVLFVTCFVGADGFLCFASWISFSGGFQFLGNDKNFACSKVSLLHSKHQIKSCILMFLLLTLQFWGLHTIYCIYWNSSDFQYALYPTSCLIPPAMDVK